MTILEIITLSFVQALTEFLPVSSSGHLILLPKITGWQDQGLDMDVAVHLGTLLSVLVYFRHDLWRMIQDVLSYSLSGFRSDLFTPSVHLSVVLVAATLPAVIAGYCLKKFFTIPRSTELIAFTAIFFGCLLYSADRLKARFFCERQMTMGQGLVVGLAQAIALIPGTSRSGICLTAARFLGYDRVSAARFAFLLSIPSILGAAVLTGHDAIQNGTPILTFEIGLAILLSFIFGILAIRFMLKFISHYTLTPFVVYRILLGIMLLVAF